ncbi:YhgE/Pip domain-containing protein [Rubeoparvulum massiliense]|uniref:YhgE/Pip domain-containing protein n=1 Tax=Rubeoparvulum massiliense TaxID=1631346 RepID=UPI00164D9C65|nr:YhgE/Pip domain-containing protein [Rubeoparvulum massiliense]
MEGRLESVMRGFELFRKDLKLIFTNPKFLIPILVVLLIPFIYSATFLWAFWDPYAQMDELPVAVVNLDEGATFNQEEIHLGDDVVDKLKADDNFKWTFVTREEAEAGLNNLDYYMMVEIPRDFSSKATQLMDDSSQQLEIRYVPNESYNFLASQIGGTAVERIKEKVANEITDTFVSSMLDGVDEIANGLQEASDGSQELYDGTLKAHDGAVELQKGLALLAEKSLVFKDGTAQVVDGANRLADGLETMHAGTSQMATVMKEQEPNLQRLNQGMGQMQQSVATLYGGVEQLTAGYGELVTGQQQAAQGHSQLEQGLEASTQGALELQQGTAALAQGLQAMVEANPTLAQQPEFQQLLAVSQKVAGGMTELSQSQQALLEGAKHLQDAQSQVGAGMVTIQEKLNQLQQGTAQLAAGSNQLATGLDEAVTGWGIIAGKMTEVAGGTEALCAGSQQLMAGVQQLGDGADQLATGAGTIHDGSSTLVSGISTIADGTNTLATKLNDAATEVADQTGSSTASERIADPLTIQEDKLNPVPNYGTGFAPYFLSLGFFVGALILSIVIPMREPAGIPKTGLGWFIGKFTTPALVGVIQAVIADLVLLYGLGLEVQSVPLFFFFSIITSVTFMAIIQFLVVTLDNPGRFIAILLLILQLVGSAGTFPLEAVPPFLQNLNPWLPMTYSVFGLKAVISSGDLTMMWHNAEMLGIFFAIFAAGTWLYFLLQHKRKFYFVNDMAMGQEQAKQAPVAQESHSTL